jgi:hypothetical protein
MSGITLRSSGETGPDQPMVFRGGREEGEFSHGGWLGSDLFIFNRFACSIRITSHAPSLSCFSHSSPCCKTPSPPPIPTIPVGVRSSVCAHFSRIYTPTAIEDFHKIALTISPEHAANFDDFIRDCHNKLAAGDHVYHFRRLYTDASILKVVHSTLSPSLDPSAVAQAIKCLDMAIIVAGAAGPGRHSLILDLIQRIQLKHMPLMRPSPLPDVSLSTKTPPVPAPVLAARQSVRRFNIPPSLVSFQRSTASRPFIIPGHAADWPALNERPWHSTHYLRTVSGPGRVVPIEVGSDYRSDDWSQKIMGWDDFVTSLTRPSNDLLYMAQHSLFLQFPNMREDIIVPDYVYSCPNSSESFPGYKPPTNDEQLVLNAWLGPKGTVSPAHVASGFLPSLIAVPTQVSSTSQRTLTTTVMVCLIVLSSIDD